MLEEAIMSQRKVQMGAYSDQDVSQKLAEKMMKRVKTLDREFEDKFDPTNLMKAQVLLCHSNLKAQNA
jgi:hypothetical protein